jgi:ribosomal protein RSM22 (predicted rRNA methylase)
LIDKNDKVTSKEVKNVFDALGQEQGEKYKHLLQSVKDFTNKYNNEKITIDKLSENLEKLSRNPYSIENNKQMQKVMQDINSHNKKLAIIKSSLDSSVQRKNAFESNFASQQISKSMTSTTTKAVIYNTAKSVFDKYAFPAIDAFGEKYYIEKTTLEGK